MAIIPSSITINMISKLNNLNKHKFLILSGVVQIVTFLVCFYALVPLYSSMGAAISILIAYLCSSLLLIVVTDYKSLKYIIYASLSVLAGFFVGYIVGMIMGQEQPFLRMISSVAMSALIIFASKNMTIKETNILLKSIFQRS